MLNYSFYCWRFIYSIHTKLH